MKIRFCRKYFKQAKRLEKRLICCKAFFPWASDENDGEKL
ncbi:hypothetical protein B4125_3378 [Bacillus paralicheniformis]|nr:hypothetical protein B4125_3378 [Bacillus paralicheniformis]TWK38596.1 hypothetical protein CHCC20347_3855 [Bacillus paralicheniformis]TWN68508.1 hypothetical protein CHCC12620_4459 [Bacillus paralicheniformis]